MTEKSEKPGKMKVTVELEVNEELMNVIKEGMANMGSKIPEMMKGSKENKE
jgi:hypothetical protein